MIQWRYQRLFEDIGEGWGGNPISSLFGLFHFLTLHSSFEQNCWSIKSFLKWFWASSHIWVIKGSFNRAGKNSGNKVSVYTTWP